jgi:alkylhydroperoxidase family enzyme
VLAIVMMGFLNKFMHAIGVELEEPVVAEVSDLIGPAWNPGAAGRALSPNLGTKPPPPADSLTTKLRLLPLLPGVIRLDRGWQKGVPKRWPEARSFLRERTGHDFAVLSRLGHGRAVRAVATMLKDNLDPATTLVGLDVKVLAGAIFARVVGDDRLAEDVGALAARHSVTEAQLAVAATFAGSPDASPHDDDPRRAALLLLSRAASPSPAKMDAAIVAACSNAGLTSAEIVELVCWLSVLQMLHRLTCFYNAAPDCPGARGPTLPPRTAVTRLCTTGMDRDRAGTAATPPR